MALSAPVPAQSQPPAGCRGYPGVQPALDRHLVDLQAHLDHDGPAQQVPVDHVAVEPPVPHQLGQPLVGGHRHASTSKSSSSTTAACVLARASFHAVLAPRTRSFSEYPTSTRTRLIAPDSAATGPSSSSGPHTLRTPPSRHQHLALGDPGWVDRPNRSRAYASFVQRVSTPRSSRSATASSLRDIPFLSVRSWGLVRAPQRRAIRRRPHHALRSRAPGHRGRPAARLHLSRLLGPDLDQPLVVEPGRGLQLAVLLDLRRER